MEGEEDEDVFDVTKLEKEKKKACFKPTKEQKVKLLLVAEQANTFSYTYGKRKETLDASGVFYVKNQFTIQIIIERIITSLHS